MSTSKILYTALLLLVLSGSGGAELSKTQQERLDRLEANETIGKIVRQAQVDFQKSLENESVGRFQALRLSNEAALILDTKEGHLWVWLAKGDTFLIYEGQVFPGARMGDVIDSYRLKQQQ